MSGISIVAFRVNCSQSLLLCQDIDTRQMAFRDMGACRAQLSRIIEDQQRHTGGAGVVMGKCRYLLADPPRDRQIVRLRKGRRAASAAFNGF